MRLTRERPQFARTELWDEKLKMRIAFLTGGDSLQYSRFAQKAANHLRRPISVYSHRAWPRHTTGQHGAYSLSRTWPREQTPDPLAGWGYDWSVSEGRVI